MDRKIFQTASNIRMPSEKFEVPQICSLFRGRGLFEFEQTLVDKPAEPLVPSKVEALVPSGAKVLVLSEVEAFRRPHFLPRPNPFYNKAV
ncbi:hypothetical protein [Neisseria chenwenguii]|uniref:hypothetical protein n=1 Tax=Neisseria chenwenguii TaxID=1853278 RepID=UPI000F4FB326|nr:hypothetical protein [Neisseria chenwenguii]